MARIAENITSLGYVPQGIRRKSTLETYAGALDRIDAAHKEALDQINAINGALGQLDLNPAEDEFLQNYIADIKNQLDTQATFGNYSGALDTAKQLAGKVLTDPAIKGRIRYQQEYKAAKEAVDKNPNINQVTKDRWNEQNPYAYEDRYDDYGNVISGTSFAPNWTPVKHLNMTEIYGALKNLAAEEAGGADNVMFMREDGSLTTNPEEGFFGMAYKQGNSYHRLSEEKLKSMFDRLFREYPDALQSIMQDRDDLLWQYNKANDEDKKAFIGSDIMDSKGLFYSVDEYLAHRVNPVLKGMAYNRVENRMDYGQAYAARQKAIKDGAASKQIRDMLALQSQTESVPIEIPLDERFGDAFNRTQSSLGLINQFLSATDKGKDYLQSKEYADAVNNGNYGDVAKALTTGDFGLDDKAKANVYNIAELLQTEGGIVNAVLQKVGDEKDRQMLLFNAAMLSGAALPDNNEYTIKYNSYVNDLFTYPGYSHNYPNMTAQLPTDKIAIQFEDDAQYNSFKSNYIFPEGITSDDITITTYKNKPTIIINKNSNLTAIADALDKTESFRTEPNWFKRQIIGGTHRPIRLYGIDDKGNYIDKNVSQNLSLGNRNVVDILAPYSGSDINYDTRTTFTDVFKTNGIASNRSVDSTQNIVKKYGLQSTLTTTPIPVTSGNILAANQLYSEGILDHQQWTDLTKYTNNTNIENFKLGIAGLQHYEVYAQNEKGLGNLVKVPLKDIGNLKKLLIDNADADNLQFATWIMPTGEPGTMIRVKARVDNKGNEVRVLL